MKKVFIIAEAGISHNGNAEIAKKMVDVALEAKADAIKFQSFKSGKAISRYAPKAEYQQMTTNREESQLEMVKKLELTAQVHEELFNYCEKKGIIFLSSPFDLESVDMLNGLGLKIFKVPSGEITNLPLLRKVGSLGKEIIMSTGMADLKEIENALDILIKAGTEKAKITILQCNTEYPTPCKDVNLRAMVTIGETFKVAVGYSDHTLGIEMPIAAVALGARVIEKHFTLDRNMEGPDHKISLEPDELKTMIVGIRNVEMALGDGVKETSPSELKNRPIVRKSIIAAKNIKEGDIFTEENIITKRPGKGINPMEWDKVIGKTAKKDFLVDQPIEL